jgi:hypothetical protein
MFRPRACVLRQGSEVELKELRKNTLAVIGFSLLFPAIAWFLPEIRAILRFVASAVAVVIVVFILIIPLGLLVEALRCSYWGSGKEIAQRVGAALWMIAILAGTILALLNRGQHVLSP